MVKPGDAVNADDPLVTLETDKATMEVPAPPAGTVEEILVKVGDKVSEGTPILHADGRRRRADDASRRSPRSSQQEPRAAGRRPGRAAAAAAAGARPPAPGARRRRSRLRRRPCQPVACAGWPASSAST